MKKSGVEIWVKRVLPKVGQSYSAAVVFFNRRTDGTPTRVGITLRDLNLTLSSGYEAQELFDGAAIGLLRPRDKLSFQVNPSGYIIFFHVEIIIDKFELVEFVNRCRDGEIDCSG